jgi:hypothetical protein
MGIVLCLLALFGTVAAGRKSLGFAFGSVLATGYLYGILRARVPDTACYFVFDCALIGFYATQIPAILSKRLPSVAFMRVAPLILWPFFMLFVPFQDILIQLVGLRAAIFFLPCMLLGASADEKDLVAIARFAAAMNIVAFVFALLEYQFGIEPFFPRTAATQLIYESHDVASGLAHRIPATFVNAHAYGGTMVAVMPFLVSRWQAPAIARFEKNVIATGIVGGAIGTFMAGARTPVVFLGIEVMVLALSLKLSTRAKVGLVVLSAVVAWPVLQSDRLQRFTTLSDTEYVSARLEGSANLGVLETIYEHPLGAGLGSAWGTNIPHFLQDQAREQIGAENEFARIALEQSPVGLILWIWCITATLIRRPEPVSPRWAIGTRLFRIFVGVSWGAAIFGTGLLAAIPASGLILFQMGLLNRDRTPRGTLQGVPHTGVSLARQSS